MSKSVRTYLDIGNIERVLSELPLEMRHKTLPKALRAGGKVVQQRAKQLCPKPGYPGDKPDKKPLRDTIGVEVRVYDRVILSIVGPEYPAGAHGHLVEFGHRIATPGTGTLRRQAVRERKRESLIAAKGRYAVISPPKSKIGKTGEGVDGGFVKGRPFMRPAADETRTDQQAAIIAALKAANG